MFKGISIAFYLFLVLSVVVNAQRDSKWAWSSKKRNDIDEPRDRQSDRRKFESVEDFRDRYEVNEQTTRKPNINGDEFYGNTNSLGGDGGNGIGISNGGVGPGSIGAGSGSRLGFIAPNGVTGNGYNSNGIGYNSNGFGPFGPQGLGAPNNFNYPQFGNQFNGPAYNPGFGYPNNNNNLRPGFNNNFYPNGGAFPPNYANGPYYPGGGGGGGGFGPNRYPYNPLGNSAANGVLVGPGGPTGVYGRPPNYAGQNNFGGPGGPGAPGGLYNNNNNFGGPFNGPFPPNGGGGGFPPNGGGFPLNGGGFPLNGPIGPNGPFPPIAFNSKSGAGILAQNDEPKGRDIGKNSNK